MSEPIHSTIEEEAIFIAREYVTTYADAEEIAHRILSLRRPPASAASPSPGPWIVIRVSQPRPYYSIDARDGFHEVAIMPVGDNVPAHAANARLVASAPDLLEACRDAVDYYPTDAAPGYMSAIRAAVAKAQGEPA